MVLNLLIFRNGLLKLLAHLRFVLQSKNFRQNVTNLEVDQKGIGTYQEKIWNGEEE